MRRTGRVERRSTGCQWNAIRMAASHRSESHPIAARGRCGCSCGGAGVEGGPAGVAAASSLVSRPTTSLTRQCGWKVNENVDPKTPAAARVGRLLLPLSRKAHASSNTEPGSVILVCPLVSCRPTSRPERPRSSKRKKNKRKKKIRPWQPKKMQPRRSGPSPRRTKGRRVAPRKTRYKKKRQTKTRLAQGSWCPTGVGDRQRRMAVATVTRRQLGQEQVTRNKKKILR